MGPTQAGLTGSSMWTAAGLAVGLAPVAFLAIAFAAGVLEPNSDASPGVLAIESGVMLVALGAGAAALSRRLTTLRRCAPWLAGRDRCVAALIGALRAAMTLLGPVNIVGFAASNFAVPELVKRRLSRRGMVRAAIALSLVLVAVDAAWGGVLLLLPDPVGEALLGDTWHEARGVLLAMVVFT